MMATIKREMRVYLKYNKILPKGCERGTKRRLKAAAVKRFGFQRECYYLKNAQQGRNVVSQQKKLFTAIDGLNLKII